MYVYKVPLHVRFKDMSHFSPVFNTYVAQYYNLYTMKWLKLCLHIYSVIFPIWKKFGCVFIIYCLYIRSKRIVHISVVVPGFNRNSLKKILHCFQTSLFAKPIILIVLVMFSICLYSQVVRTTDI